jgi:thymidylate synthase (FAD)
MFNPIGDDMEWEASIPPAPIPLLDHGYIKLIETWGSDERIIEAARMSTDGAFRGWGPVHECVGCGKRFDSPQGTLGCQSCGDSIVSNKPGDEKLLSYLYKNNHATPFEMAGCVIEVQAPIFVFREWHRHRTQSYNELSARYTPLPDLYYTPTVERCMLNSVTNKQAGRASGSEKLTAFTAMRFVGSLQQEYLKCEELYQAALKQGVPKELARCIMPVGHYSRMRASANLRNWLGFLTLRQAPNAQWEIRQYADALNTILVERFPRTMELFNV